MLINDTFSSHLIRQLTLIVSVSTPSQYHIHTVMTVITEKLGDVHQVILEQIYAKYLNARMLG